MNDSDGRKLGQHHDVEADVARRLKPGPAFDPVNLMTQIFDDASIFVGPAEDVLLSWLMRLSPEVEQPWAAKQVLETIVGDLDPEASTECVKLRELLRQASTNCDLQDGSTRRRRGRASRGIV